MCSPSAARTSRRCVVVAIILLQLAGLVRWRWAWMLAPVVLLYCLLAGSPASAVRATVMALGVLLAWRLGRPLNALGCWSIAALAMMTWDPRVLLDPGAQLSFGVVLGLILLSPPIYRLLVARFQPRCDSAAPPAHARPGARGKILGFRDGALLAASIAATLVSEPITALDFHQVTPISVVANLLVVPLAGLITVVGTVSVAFSLVQPRRLAAQINNANWLLAKMHDRRSSRSSPTSRARRSTCPIFACDRRSPRRLFVVAPMQDSACLLVRNAGQAWLVDTGREAPPPPLPGALPAILRHQPARRRSSSRSRERPDNGGAPLIARQFHPRRLPNPALPSRSPWQRQLPQIAEAVGVKVERWQQGQRLRSRARSAGGGARSGGGTAGHTRERPLARAAVSRRARHTLLCGGPARCRGPGGAFARSSRVARRRARSERRCGAGRRVAAMRWASRILAAHAVRASAISTCRTATEDAPSCAVWPLEKTGAVTIHFTAASPGHEAGMDLRPWAALPAQK